MDALIVRPAIEADIEAITEIYNHYVLTSPATFDIEPHTVEQRRVWFSRYGVAGPHRLLVGAMDGRVLGFATSSPFRERAAYSTSVETSVYCHPDATGKGVGTALYTRLFDELAGEDVHRALAGTTLPNDASIAMHKKFGFIEIGVYTEVGRKFGRYWDVAWFEKRLT